MSAKESPGEFIKHSITAHVGNGWPTKDPESSLARSYLHPQSPNYVVARNAHFLYYVMEIIRILLIMNENPAANRFSMKYSDLKEVVSEIVKQIRIPAVPY